jgi:hypothetical protein
MILVFWLPSKEPGGVYYMATIGTDFRAFLEK